MNDFYENLNSKALLFQEMLNESSNPVNASVAEEAIEDAVRES